MLKAKVRDHIDRLTARGHAVPELLMHVFGNRAGVGAAIALALFVGPLLDRDAGQTLEGFVVGNRGDVLLGFPGALHSANN